MDACFEVLVKEFRPHPSMERRHHVVHWGGEAHAQGPDSFLWGDHVQLKLVSDPLPPFIQTRLPDDFQNVRWERVQIDGDILDQLAYEATGGEVEWDGKSLEDLLPLLLVDRESWVVVFLPHWDQLDEVIDVNAADVTEELRRGFAGVPIGFLGLHRGATNQ